LKPIIDEFELVIIPPIPNKIIDRKGGEEAISTKGILKNKLLKSERGSSMNISFEENIENMIVQMYAKNQSNLKRRKINVFKNDDYLPD